MPLQTLPISTFYCKFAVIMNASDFRQSIKPWILPIAMLTGVLFHNYINIIAFASPCLIFLMLLITFCKVTPKDLHLPKIIWILLSIQIIGSLLAYVLIRPLSIDVAQGAFICIFCPTATAAPVVTGLLGGSVTLLATYSLVSNVCVALLAPMLFAVIGTETDISFIQAMATISLKVFPLILSPLALAFIFKAFMPKIHRQIADRQSLSFYLWAFALIIVVGNAVSFMMKEPPSKIPEMIVLALVSLIACCGQFYIGRRIGKKYGDKISGAQGLGQKNTVLAIWMALTYLNPIASVGPAAYVAWQNTINSIQLYYKNRQPKHSPNACRH